MFLPIDHGDRERVRERLPSIRPPMPKKTRLDVFLLQWFLQQWVLLQVQHTQTQVQRGMEQSSKLVDLIFRQLLAGDGRACLGVNGPLVRTRGEVALGYFGGHRRRCRFGSSMSKQYRLVNEQTSEGHEGTALKLLYLRYLEMTEPTCGPPGTTVGL